MTVGGIETRFDHLETADVTGVENDLSVMDGTDFDTGAGGGLGHGGRRGRGGGGEWEGGRKRKGRNLCTGNRLRSFVYPWPTAGWWESGDIGRCACDREVVRYGRAIGQF